MAHELAAFILTHGRPSKVKTDKLLRAQGFTGKIYYIVDDLDSTLDEYIKRFGDDVIVFSKKQAANTFDIADNFQEMRSVVYARNASFQIAKDLGIKYFMQIDDDHDRFCYRFDGDLNYCEDRVNNLDQVFSALLSFMKNTPAHAIAISQNGDFQGGKDGFYAEKPMLTRKGMGTFILSSERPFEFIGRINEDVTTYTRLASIGLLVFMCNQVSVKTQQTQKNKGGMTELYLDNGTYVKSFYSVMMQPSSVKIRNLKTRLHHFIKWDNTFPKILRETIKKQTIG